MWNLICVVARGGRLRAGYNEAVEEATTLRVQLPEDIAHRLEACWRDMPRRALEAIAVEGYRSGALTRAEVGRLLEFSFWETEAFLKERQAYLPYDEADLDQDRDALDKIQSE